MGCLGGFEDMHRRSADFTAELGGTLEQKVAHQQWEATDVTASEAESSCCLHTIGLGSFEDMRRRSADFTAELSGTLEQEVHAGHTFTALITSGRTSGGGPQ